MAFENLEMTFSSRVNNPLVVRVSTGKKYGSSMSLLENIVFSTYNILIIECCPKIIGVIGL